jgi:hypothetical protein
MRKILMIAFLIWASLSANGQYCTPFNTGCYEDGIIGKVISYNAVQNIDYTASSGCATNAYKYISNQTLTVRPGDFIHLYIESIDEFASPSFYTVFVDWNATGNFTAQMEVWNSVQLIEGSAVSAAFTVPPGASIGTTRMRIKKVSNTNVAPCSGGGNEGEFLDFDVHVQATGGCPTSVTTGTITPSSSLICSGNTVLLFSQQGQSGPGQVYQWQTSTNQVSWSNMVGASAPITEISATNQGYFRLITSCGGQSDTSQVLQIAPINALPASITVNPNLTLSADNAQNNGQLSGLLRCAAISQATTVTYAPQSGPYTKQLSLKQISGLSATNTLTINGNGNDFIPEKPYVTNGFVNFDGVSHITLEHFHIEVPLAIGGNTIKCIQLSNGSADNTIQNCTIEMPINNNQFLYGIAGFNGNNTPSISGTPSPCDRIIIKDNHIVGGRFGIYLQGSNVNSKLLNPIIEDNHVADFQATGIYMRFVNEANILSNEISRLNRTTQFLISGTSGMEIVESPGFLIENNLFRDLIFPNLTFSTSIIGIMVSNNDGNQNLPNAIANNLFVEYQTQRGTITGIQLQGNNRHVKIVHNTFSYRCSQAFGPAVNFSGIRAIASGAAPQIGCEFSNNILVGEVHGGSQWFYAINFAQGSNSLQMQSNNNVIYDYGAPASNFYVGAWQSANVKTLSDWRLESGFDLQTRFDDPMFLGGQSDSAFIPQNGAIKSMGANFTAISPLDRLGVTRPLTPDPGAYQFDVPPGVAPDLISAPTFDTLLCSGSHNVQLMIDNVGSAPMTSVTITRKVNGVVADTVIISQTIQPRTPTLVNTGPLGFVPNQLNTYEFEVIGSTPTMPLNFGNKILTFQDFRTGFQGVYTMNPGLPISGTNFQSINGFIDALRQYGICGHVTLEVVPGLTPLSGQVSISGLATGPQKTLTIKGNGNTLFTPTFTTDQRSVIRVLGVDYVTLDSLNIECFASNRIAVHLDGDAHYFTLKNAFLNGRQGAQYSQFGFLVGIGNTNGSIAPNSAASTHIIVENNVFEGFEIPIAFNGRFANGEQIKNVEISRNVIRDFFNTGLSIGSMDSLEVASNIFERPNFAASTGIHRGILMAQSTFTKLDIHKNIFRNMLPSNLAQHPSSLAIMDFSGARSGFAPSSSSNQVYNNIIHDNTSRNQIVAFLSRGGVHDLKILHNTIYYDQNIPPNNANSVAFIGLFTGFSTGANNHLTFKNNLMFVKANHLSITEFYRVESSNQFLARNTIDYNAGYFEPFPGQTHHYATIQNSSYDYSQLQASNFAFDANGVDANPLFIDPATGNFTPSSSGIHRAGDNLLHLVNHDIFDTLRVNPPDPGAIAFEPLLCQGIIGFMMDSSTSQSISLSWRSAESQFDLWYGPVGAPAGDPTGTIVPIGQRTFILSNIPNSTCYDFWVREDCGAAQSPWVGPITFCTPAQVDIHLQALLSPVDTDCGLPAQLVTLQVKNEGLQLINSIPLHLSLSGDLQQTLQHTWFGNLQPGDSTQITFGALDTRRGGNINVNVWAQVANDGNPTNDTISDAMLIFPDSIAIQQRHWCTSGDPAFFEAPNIPGIQYAWFETPGQLTPSFIGNTYAAGNQSPGFTVYVAYANSNCLQNRQPVTLRITGAPQSQFTFAENQLQVTFSYTGASADSVYWVFGNGLGFASGFSPTFTFPYPWNFPVCVFAYNRCGADTLCQTVPVTGAIGTEDFNLQRWKVFPNPTSGVVYIEAVSGRMGENFLKVVDVNGRTVHQERFSCEGQCQHAITLSAMALGAYQLIIEDAQGALWQHRILITK